MRVPLALGVVLLVAGLVCARAARARAEPSQQARLDPQLRRLAQTHPDSVVAAVVELRRAPTRADLRRLQRAGLGVGSVSGVLVYVRGRARALRSVADSSSVKYIQLSRSLRPQSSGWRARTSPISGGSA